MQQLGHMYWSPILESKFLEGREGACGSSYTGPCIEGCVPGAAGHTCTASKCVVPDLLGQHNCAGLGSPALQTALFQQYNVVNGR